MRLVLEIDPRCTQIAAFNLALTAWRRVGQSVLPAMNLACSGLAPNAKREDWLKLAGNDDRLQHGMDGLYRLFLDAPLLGSLIHPKTTEIDLLTAPFYELAPLLQQALAREVPDVVAHEMAVTAHGIYKAVEILNSSFTLVATNVPYLGRGNQSEVLADFCERAYPDAKNDLATCFLSRCASFCSIQSGTTAVVIPQNWLSQVSYRLFRERLLDDATWNLVGRLGPKAFQTPMWDFNVQLLILTNSSPTSHSYMHGLDVSEATSAPVKSRLLPSVALVAVSQTQQRKSPNARVSFSELSTIPPLGTRFTALFGSSAGDRSRFIRCFWEVICADRNTWEFHQSTPSSVAPFVGREEVILWEQEKGEMYRLAESVKHLNHKAQQWRSGKPNWGRRGVVVSLMANLPATLYSGEIYAAKCTAIVPIDDDESHLAALWSFCSSEAFATAVREINQRLAIEVKEILQVPFDVNHWLRVANEQYPNGLPKPASSDPTQWLFNGHPNASKQPLQVALARLLGYVWPRQAGSSFLDCPSLEPDGLEMLGYADGIVCLSATKGEPAAAERLRGLLAQAYGEDWSVSVQQDLLAQVGYAGETLDDWLRDGFFEQHCALFHHRPFIWHIWDGNKNGFSALVNYHKLNYAALESLTYSYLGLWIQRQQAAVDAGEAGSDARLQAAKQLQAKLKLILGGEPPYDLFVRWKPLSQQAIGWHPDLNDGVRLNIRPFATADILRKRVKIKWDKDRGKEPVREQKDFPWFWGWNGKTQDFAGAGTEPDGNRWNDLHYTNEAKRKARGE